MQLTNPNTTIRDALTQTITGVKIDRAWINKLSRFRIGFTLRNESHMRFFGGNLFGTEKVRFTAMDRAFIFEELLNVNETDVEHVLHQLPNIEVSFNVTGDTLNNVLVWLIYTIHTTKGLTDKERRQGMMDASLIMNYRFYTSLNSRYFSRYLADPDVATAMYANLSKRFELKRLGSWNRVFEERSSAYLAPNSIHYKTLTTMHDDIEVRYAISDAQGRIRSMFKFLFKALCATMSAGEKIRTSSSVLEHEGEQILKDRTGSLGTYTEYLRTIIGERNAFIKPPLVAVIEQIMPTMPPKLFMGSLEAMVSQSARARNAQVDEILSKTLIHAFGYLFQNRQVVRNTQDLSGILAKLRGTYSSSRNTDVALLQLREQVEHYIATQMKIRHAGNLAATRTGVLLYIVARAMTMKHYSQ